MALIPSCGVRLESHASLTSIGSVNIHKSSQNQELLTCCCRQKAAPQTFLDTPGRRSLQGRYITEQPATDIADSLMTNPWTAALVHDSSDGQQLYDKGSALTRAGLGSWDEPHWSGRHPTAEQAAQEEDDPAAPCCSDHEHPCGPDEQDDACSSHSEGVEPRLSSHAEQAQGACSSEGSEADQPSQGGHEPSRGTGGPPCPASASRLSRTGSESASAGSEKWHDCGDTKQRAAPISAKAEDCVDKQKDDQPVTAPAACHGLKGQQHISKQSDQKQQPQRQKDFSSWTGDYGHLDSPRITAAHSHAWQAELRDRRDCPTKELDMQARDDYAEVRRCTFMNVVSHVV